jgi:hypothetical protein
MPAPSRRAALTAALGSLQLRPRAPELRLLRRWARQLIWTGNLAAAALGATMMGVLHVSPHAGSSIACGACSLKSRRT